MQFGEKWFEDHPASAEKLNLPENERVENQWNNDDEYTDEEGKKHSFKADLLSVNFSLFANTDITRWAGSMYFFIQNDSLTNVRPVLNTMFDSWGFSKQFISRLLLTSLKYLKWSKTGAILQIFIPKNKVDDFVYVAGNYGVPFREPIFKGADGFDNKLHRHPKISPVREQYVSDPSAAIALNKPLHARIVMLPDFFSPSSGIVYKSYIPEQAALSSEDEQAYKQELNSIVQDMLIEWVATERYERLSGNKVNEPFIKFLRSVKKSATPTEITGQESAKKNKDELLDMLVQDFKRYHTLNKSFHQGNLYQHSMWVAQTIATWCNKKSNDPWCNIEKQTKERDIFLVGLAGFLHDTGKAGDQIILYYDKADHPAVGFDYLRGEKNISYKINNRIISTRYLTALGLMMKKDKLLKS